MLLKLLHPNLKNIILGREQIILTYCHNKDVLDVGCVGPENVGNLHKSIAKVARSLFGIDIDSSGLEKLRKQGYNVMWGDAENFDLGKQFDVVVGGELIEHLSNPGLFLRNVHRHLHPGGILILTTPNAYSLRIIIEMFWKGYADVLSLKRAFEENQHVLWHSEETLISLARRHGFRVKAIYYAAYQPTNWKTKLLTAVLRLLSPKFFAPTLLAICERPLEVA